MRKKVAKEDSLGAKVDYLELSLINLIKKFLFG